MVVKTRYYESLIDGTLSIIMYDYLKDNMRWTEGITSKQGHTRMACMMTLGDDPNLDEFLKGIFERIDMPSMTHLGLYINYYLDGNDFVPSHSHKGQCQIIVSLGVTRTLIVGKGSYKMSNGDVIVFGSATHSIPKEPEVKGGRISIVVFGQPL